MYLVPYNFTSSSTQNMYLIWKFYDEKRLLSIGKNVFGQESHRHKMWWAIEASIIYVDFSFFSLVVSMPIQVIRNCTSSFKYICRWIMHDWMCKWVAYPAVDEKHILDLEWLAISKIQNQ